MEKGYSRLSVDSGGWSLVRLLEGTEKACGAAECQEVASVRGLCKKHYDKSRYRPSPRVKKEQSKCRSCSGFFTPTKNSLGLFCSKACYGESMRTEYPHSKVFFNTCRVCSTKWTDKTSALVCGYKCHTVEVFRAAAKEIACADCRTVFCPTYEASRGRPSHCCQPCADEARRQTKATQRSARKAKERTATVEKVDPFKVFARDKWHCQNCGVSTPRSLRGSYADDAPELDHIKPLSKGGDHSYKNTQCLCRRCNQEKSDTWQPQGEESLLQA